MKIRRSKDADTIAQLNKEVHEIHSERYPEYFKEYEYEGIKKFFEEVVHKEGIIFLLAEDNSNLPLGYAMIEIRNYPENVFKKSYQSVYVHQISILKSHRGKGFGRKLMEAVYDIAKENGIKSVELDYWVENEEAKTFYEKLGFTRYREFVYKSLSL